MTTLEIDSDSFETAIARLPNTLRISLDFRFKQHGAFFERVMDDVFTARPTGPFRGNSTSDKLINRTGSLRRSYRAKVFQIKGSQSPADTVLRASIGNAQTAHYVFTQEDGGTIRPKTSQFLAIPMPDNLTGAGRVRFEKPREIEGLFVLRFGGKAYLVRRAGPERLEFLFILKREVYVPPRLGFVKRWDSAPVERDRITRVNLGIRDALAKVGL